MNIQSINDDFNYNNITLGNPQSIQGGSYYAKIFTGDSSLIYVQLPKCLTKQGVMSTKKNKYCDLMYERSDSNLLIDWIEKIEEKILKIISDKKDIWFHNELTNSDIETMINPISRSFKSGKYILIRTNIECNKHTGKTKCVGYDEKEIHIDIDTLESSTSIIPLILLEGIRFTSRSFEIDVKLIQFMTIDNSVIEHKCLIKKTDNKESTSDNLEKKSIKEESNDSGEKLLSPTNIIPMTLLSTKDTIESPTLTKSENENQVEKHEKDVVQEDIVDSETVHSEIVHLETADLETADLEKADSETADLETADLKKVDSEMVDPEFTDTETVDSEMVNRETVGDVKKDNMDGNNVKKPLDTDLTLEKNEIEEITLDVTGENLDEIRIREPNEIYYEIYQSAKHKAKELKTKALKAHLEAKQIKVKYMLDDSDDSDNDDIQNYLE